MSNFSFYTIKDSSEGYYKESGSKFLAFAYPVDSEAEIKEKIEQLRKKYFDATHHCFAWILDPDKNRFRAVDDGEPNHSAGDPILGQIRSKNLTNVLVVVVRYYGGVKLGVGGLIQAYKLAAEEALSNSQIIEREVTEKFLIRYPYDETPEVMKLIKDFDVKILSQEFAEDCLLKAQVKLKEKDELMNKITLLNALGRKISLSVIQ
ncbi:MAG: YigZ family protein [Cyclobacteriaceae bacterium]